MSRARAQAHAKHAAFCSCGRVVHGNGARWMHRQMHLRRDDGHHYINRERYVAEFGHPLARKENR